MSTPRKMGKQSNSQADQQVSPMNRTYPHKQKAKQDDQLRSKSYEADTSVRNAGQFIPPTRPQLSENNHSSSEDNANQTVFHGQSSQKPRSAGTNKCELRNTGMQTSPAIPAPKGMTGGTQTSPKRDTQVGGTQTSPLPSPKRATSLGGIQTTLR